MIRFLKLIFNRFKKLLKLNDINSMNNKVKVINKNYKKKQEKVKETNKNKK